MITPVNRKNTQSVSRPNPNIAEDLAIVDDAINGTNFLGMFAISNGRSIVIDAQSSDGELTLRKSLVNVIKGFQDKIQILSKNLPNEGVRVGANVISYNKILSSLGGSIDQRKGINQSSQLADWVWKFQDLFNIEKGTIDQNGTKADRQSHFAVVGPKTLDQLKAVLNKPIN